ncbi:MAG: M1 family metallopeptidase [Deltaproteobacteria bacterium]|nr:M1 family metallopeptidase [Deltaproteobacteria bacterium]
MSTTPEPGRLPADPRPTRYALSLETDPARDGFEGRVEIQLAVEQAAGGVHLHALDLTLDRIELQVGESRRALTARPAEGPGREPEHGELVLSDGEPIPAGEAFLRIDFHGPFNGSMCGLYKVVDGGKPYLATQFEAADARRCFPCFDEPAFKVPFELTLRVPSGTPCFANGPEVERREEGERTVVRFEETPPIPTYLLALCVGPFEIVEAEPAGATPVRVIVPEGKAHLAEVARRFTPELLMALEDLFGLPYPYSKLDVVAVPEFAAGAMENAGLVTFREIYLLADEANLTRSRAREIAEVVAHELAHHWFGNLVTMEWWDDLWLNEAFATWVAARVVDQWRPEYEQVLALLEVRGRVMAQDALPAARQIRQPVHSVGDAEQAFDAITYLKGAAVLETIERWIGEDAFRSGVRAYLEAHRWGNARGEDLFSRLDAASGKDVTGVIRSFIEQPGVPLLVVEEAGDAPRVRQAPYALVGLEPADPQARWQIPLHLAGGADLVFGEERATLPTPLRAGHPNPAEATYLRWALPEEAMSALLDRAAELDTREQLGVVGATWAAVTGGAAPLSSYLRTVEALEDVTARPIVEQVAGSPARLHSFFPGIDEHPGFRSFAASLTGSALERLGLAPREGEPDGDTIARPAVLAAAGHHARSQEVLDHVLTLGPALVSGAEASPEIARVALALAAREGALGSEALAEALFAATDPERRTALLGGLASLPAATAGEALALLLDERFRAQDFGSVFYGMMRRHETRDAAFDWLMANFEAVRKRQPEFTFIHIGQILGEYRSAGALDEAVRRLREKAVRGGERPIEQGLQAATHAIALGQRYREELVAFLDAR